MFSNPRKQGYLAHIVHVAFIRSIGLRLVVFAGVFRQYGLDETLSTYVINSAIVIVQSL